MTDDKHQTDKASSEFDFSNPSSELVYHERREKFDRRSRGPSSEKPKPAATPAADGSERRAKKERRRRIDPTTFEKQYSDDEMEFMNAMQRFKEQSGKQFPTYREVIAVAMKLGYRRVIEEAITPFTNLDDSGELLPVAMTLVDNN
jgi:hypothetical protein